MPPRAAGRRRAKKEHQDVGLKHDEIEIDFVVLADYAQAVQGKLSLIGGGWDLHHAKQYPSLLAFGLGIGILVPWSETNRQHTFTFVIRKSEGPEQLRGQGQFAVGRDVATPLGMTQRVTLGISGQIQLPEPGTYEILVTASGAEKRVTFEALPVKRGG